MSHESRPYLLERMCPSCGGTRSVEVISSSPRGEDQTFPALVESWFGFFKTKVFFTYHRCSDCNLLFSPFYFSESALLKLYSEMPDNTAGVSQGNLRKTQYRYLEALGPSPAVDGDYLELGPDIGLLTEAVIPLLKGGNIWLFEPNIAVHSSLRKLGQGRPTNISPEMANFDSVPDSTVGLCTMIHVLDHLPQATDVMKQMARKLRPGGRILIVTHDESSFLARVLGKRWPAYCLQHPHLFNAKSMEAFLRSCGLKTLTSMRTVNYFPAVYLLKHFLFAMGFKSAAKWEVWGPTVPLRLGNRVTVAVPAN